MSRLFHHASPYLWGIVAAALGYSIGHVHHLWFYPMVFHGDAAAMHVLADAMVQEGTLLPKDFSYGNQLVLFRASPFIALVSIAGLEGYQAFALGSAISVSFWTLLMYLFLTQLPCSRPTALLLSVLALIPLGYWELDFVLGQQSHLANAVLSIGIVVCISAYSDARSGRLLFFGCLSLLAMSIEAPIRGLLVLAPVLVAVLLTSPIRSFIFVFLASSLSFFLAFVVNHNLIEVRPIALDYFSTLSFRSSGELVDNLALGARQTLGGISSLDLISGTLISPLRLIVFAAGLGLTLAYFVVLGRGTAVAFHLSKHIFSGGFSGRQTHRQVVDNQGSDRLLLSAVLGVVFGAVIVAALNPDSSRHYLWAVFLLKILLFKSIFEQASVVTSGVKAVCLVLLCAVLASSWFAILAKSGWRLRPALEMQGNVEAYMQIRNATAETGIRLIFGEDFWRMMPLNTYVSNLSAQSLVLANGEPFPYYWLVRPSSYCAESDVLYYLRDGVVDEVVTGKLKSMGGIPIHQGEGYSLWRGPRVWALPADGPCQTCCAPLTSISAPEM
ncbi:hypothetical protein LC612_39935 [Nostoc sp. CHAB 5834]|nr:hypothetical protein [Nostoc sp. CHAB 5834]